MRTSIDSWNLAKEQVQYLSQALDRSEKMVQVASEAHRKDHPLDAKTLEALHGLFTTGKPLCCTKGRLNLVDLGLDACWLEYVSTWVYEHIGCAKFYRPGGSHYEEAVEKLESFLDGLSTL
jgi:hypothetical protein